MAGASEGIGAAFATELSTAGLNLILVARRPEPLQALAARLPTQCVCIAANLATSDGLAAVIAGCRPYEIGLVVCNAAYAPSGAFVDSDPAHSQVAIDLNCRAPVVLAHHFLPPMRERGRGGLIVMSSLAGNQGSAGLSLYAATKAFGAVLAEGLWQELRGSGVDVLACVPGAVASPNLAKVARRAAPGTVSAAQVAAEALGALGRRPRTVPGWFMKATSPLMTRLLPRRTAIATMARATRGVLG